MSTKNLIPRGDGEGGIGIEGFSWGSGVFSTGVFGDSLTVGGNNVALSDDLLNYATTASLSDYATTASLSDYATVAGLSDYASSDDLGECFNYTVGLTGHIIPDTNAAYDLGNAEYKIRHLFLSDNSLHIGGTTISAGDTLGEIQFPSGISVTKDSVFNGNITVGSALISSDGEGRAIFSDKGLMVGNAEVRPDPTDPESLYFSKTPQVQDSEGNPVTILTADKMGLGTAAVLESAEQDLQFKLLTDEERFVVGTTGQGNLESGWYRFNDFKVKGATDIGAHPINPVDTRIYSDESSFILFKTDSAGNRVAHLVGGDEAVTPNNAIALGIAVKVDEAEYPEDIEFVHTDGESYSVINGNSDSLGPNGLPIRQGFQAPSIGSHPAPLLIDGGSF